MRSFLILLCTLFAFHGALNIHSAYADLYDEEGNLIAPESKRGYYTLDQMAPFALKVMPGEVIEQESSWRTNDFYHEYTIQTEDGSIFSLEYIAATGRLHEIEIVKLSENPVMPPGLIEEQQAEKIALDYVANELRGRLPSKVKSVVMRPEGRVMMYFVEVRKGAKTYIARLNAFTGAVVDAKKK